MKNFSKLWIIAGIKRSIKKTDYSPKGGMRNINIIATEYQFLFE